MGMADRLTRQISGTATPAQVVTPDPSRGAMLRRTATV
jgi:hypothetical protein